jgi:hypothetical protein
MAESIEDAITSGDLGALRSLIASNANVNEVLYEQLGQMRIPMAPIVKAARLADRLGDQMAANMTGLLAEHGANIDARLPNGSTALGVVARGGHADTARGDGGAGAGRGGVGSCESNRAPK